MPVRKEFLALIIVALLIAAVFLIHPLIQGQLTTSPERHGTPPQSATDAKEPAAPAGQTPAQAPAQ